MCQASRPSGSTRRSRISSYGALNSVVREVVCANLGDVLEGFMTGIAFDRYIEQMWPEAYDHPRDDSCFELKGTTAGFVK